MDLFNHQLLVVHQYQDNLTTAANMPAQSIAQNSKVAHEQEEQQRVREITTN